MSKFSLSRRCTRLHVLSLSAVFSVALSCANAQELEAAASPAGRQNASVGSVPAATVAPALPLGAPELSAGKRRELSTLLSLRPQGPRLPHVLGEPAALPPKETQTVPADNGPNVPGSLMLFSNASPNAVLPSGNKSIINEPATAMAGRARFMTGNWYSAYSNNSGTNWTYLSPFTAFPSADGGFCCDQDVIYDRGRDMMIWLLQYIKSGSTTTSQGRFRIALYRNTRNGIGPTGWIYYDFLPTNVGGGGGEWFDYPHLALSNDHLYVAINVFRTTNDTWTRTVMFRLPLDTMSAGGALSYNYLNWTNNFNFTPVQGAKDVMYWASHINNTQIRVFRWPESSTSVSFFDRNVTAWTSSPRGTHSCPTPDGRNWCLRSDNRINAGVLSHNQLTRQGELWFFWNVGQGGNFPKPYVDAVRIRETDMANIGRPLIWSSGVTYHYAGAAANGRGDVGLTATYAMSTGYPSIMVCAHDDYTAVPAPWSCPLAAQGGTSGPSNNGWGDYVRVRPAHPTTNAWHATGFTLQGGQNGANIVPRNIVFGRERDLREYQRWTDK